MLLLDFATFVFLHCRIPVVKFDWIFSWLCCYIVKTFYYRTICGICCRVTGDDSSAVCPDA